MTKMSNDERKASREVEIDRLLAEEFECDPDFADRFAEACGLRFKTLQVLSVVAEPPLGPDGYGDLLVKANMDGRSVVLLIEDKITASAAPRQAERYKAHAARLKEEGIECVMTVLVAPKSYRGERDSYNKSVNLEQVAEMLSSYDPRRLSYRRRIIERALEKKQTKGVQNPDLALRELHSEYLKRVKRRCAAQGHLYEFPLLKEAYARTESWVEKIQHPDFPDHVWLRHRLWTSFRGDAMGRVDLIVSPASEDELVRLEAAVPEGAIMERYSKGKGIQVSFPVLKMEQSTGFLEAAASDAFSAIERLTEWYFEYSEVETDTSTSLR